MFSQSVANAGSATWSWLSTIALSLEANCGQESHHPSYVGGCGGNRIDRLLFEAGDGVNRTAPAAGRCADAATRTLCGPTRTDADARLEEEAGA